MLACSYPAITKSACPATGIAPQPRQAFHAYLLLNRKTAPLAVVSNYSCSKLRHAIPKKFKMSTIKWGITASSCASRLLPTRRHSQTNITRHTSATAPAKRAQPSRLACVALDKETPDCTAADVRVPVAAADVTGEPLESTALVGTPSSVLEPS